MTQKYNIRQDSTRVSSVIYGNDADVSFTFSQSSNKEDVQSELKRTQNVDKGLNPDKALDLLKSKVFTTSNGARNNAPKSVILFINKDADTSNLNKNIESLRKDGVNLIIVAIDGDGKPFRRFVDDPSKLFVFNNADNTKNLISPVVDATLPGMLI